jgi:hypothetical protein
LGDREAPSDLADFEGKGDSGLAVRPYSIGWNISRISSGNSKWDGEREKRRNEGAKVGFGRRNRFATAISRFYSAKWWPFGPTVSSFEETMLVSHQWPLGFDHEGKWTGNPNRSVGPADMKNSNSDEINSNLSDFRCSIFNQTTPERFNKLERLAFPC